MTILCFLWPVFGCVALGRLTILLRKSRRRTELQWAFAAQSIAIQNMALELGEALFPVIRDTVAALKTLGAELEKLQA